MTQEFLEQFRDRGAEIRAKSAEIRSLYDTRKSVPADFVSGNHNPYGRSQVERALHRIDDLKAELERDVIAYSAELGEIETWLKKCISDPIVSAIIRTRYIAGESWKRTSWIVFHSTNKSTSQMCYRRYIQEHNVFEE